VAILSVVIVSCEKDQKLMEPPQPESSFKKGKKAKDCVTIQDGTILYSAGHY